MINILYLTKEYLICEKPPNFISESGAQNSLPDALSKQLRQAGEASEIYTVHRLDKGVGGIMLYARDKKEAGRLSSLIAQKDFHKEYTAVISGRPDCDEGDMKDLLFYDRQRGKSYILARKRGAAKDAHLSYKVLEYNDSENLSLVRIVLHTGRTHQIRAQFSHRKMSLVGDRRYGGIKSDNIALLCTKLRFTDKNGNIAEFVYEPEDIYPFNLFAKNSHGA
jgi:23S rRNA pseudouridine1911/1915/1917 synthase